jgi:HK97 gp10 family phage protein
VSSPPYRWAFWPTALGDSTVSVKITGRNKLRSAVAAFRENIAAGLIEATENVSDSIVKDAKDFCPVDTGSLRESIRRETVHRKGGIFDCRVVAGGRITNTKTERKVDYAAYVELGTSRNKAQPFLAPAVEKNRQSIEALEIMKEAVTEAWGSDKNE